MEERENHTTIMNPHYHTYHSWTFDLTWFLISIGVTSIMFSVAYWIAMNALLLPEM